MNYTQKEVLSIMRSLGDKDPEGTLHTWNIDLSNTVGDIPPGFYERRFFSFDLRRGEDFLGTVTLVDLYGLNRSKADRWMQKYFGYEAWQLSWENFSHDTYFNCFLTQNGDLELTKVVEGFHEEEFQISDREGNSFKVFVAYGYPEKESEYWRLGKYEKGYRFDNDVFLLIDGKMKYEKLGDKIKEAIENRMKTIL